MKCKKSPAKNPILPRTRTSTTENHSAKAAAQTLTLPLLETLELSAFYGKRQILDSVSFSLKAGDFVCLSGPNGCGKSTLMTLLAGLGRNNLQTRGRILAEGRALSLFKSKERARFLSYMEQSESSLWNFTVFDIILSGRYCHTGFTALYSQEDKAIAHQVAEQLFLTPLLQRPCHSLSGGEFQRLRIARSLCQRPRVLLLDEPAANLDLGLRHDLLQITKETARNQGAAVLMSIHDINLAAAFADTLALLRPLPSPAHRIEAIPESSFPQLILGSPEEIMTVENLQRTYGRNFRVFTHPVHGGAAVWVE
ncbi:MAG: ABC transporter ATP-binding protein [Spirochaetaceae bacterium]|nr:ABC transporter ATP-binding protein [Spirochaetaceae bacterium]